MRCALVFALIAAVACGDNRSAPAPDADPTAPRVYPFGPFTITPGQEVTADCVQITLGNDTDLYVNSVDLTTGPGFHHSNWFWVPESDFFGSDGTYVCTDRNFSEPAAAIFGGVLFAQSTQDPKETQAFPPGVAIRIPAHSKLVAQIHLLNPTDGTINLAPTIGLTPLLQADVRTQLAAVSFEDMALALPPQTASRFTVDCDLSTEAEKVTGAPPSFNLYYALAHYHVLGTGLTFEAVKPDGTSAMIYSTQNHIGDTLGGPIDPPFDFTGYTRMRVSCDYFNNTDSTVMWGVGTNEMCVFLAFSDSTYDWAGGVTMPDAAGSATIADGVSTFTHACTVFATGATR